MTDSVVMVEDVTGSHLVRVNVMVNLVGALVILGSLAMLAGSEGAIFGFGMILFAGAVAWWGQQKVFEVEHAGGSVGVSTKWYSQAEIEAFRRSLTECIEGSRKTRQQGTDGRDNTTCPYCAETIKRAAIKCKHCGSDISETPHNESD